MPFRLALAALLLAASLCWSSAASAQPRIERISFLCKWQDGQVQTTRILLREPGQGWFFRFDFKGKSAAHDRRYHLPATGREFVLPVPGGVYDLELYMVQHVTDGESGYMHRVPGITVPTPLPSGGRTGCSLSWPAGAPQVIDFPPPHFFEPRIGTVADMCAYVDGEARNLAVTIDRSKSQPDPFGVLLLEFKNPDNGQVVRTVEHVAHTQRLTAQVPAGQYLLTVYYFPMGGGGAPGPNTPRSDVRVVDAKPWVSTGGRGTGCRIQ